MKKPAAKKAGAKEVSAGGIVRRGGEVLLVKVENLEGRVVWTFPKGHLEAGETAEQAAVREVREETGWTCRITGRLGAVRYRFERNGVPVDKTVEWFSMEPGEKEGGHDPAEIMDSRWFPLAEVRDLISYPSDKKILEKLEVTRKPKW